MNITPDPKNDMKIEIRNTQCTLIYSSYESSMTLPIYGLSTQSLSSGIYGWLSADIDSPQYYGILYSNRIFLEKLIFCPYKIGNGAHARLKNWYVEIVDKNNNWIEVCKGLSINHYLNDNPLNTADINKYCYGFRIVCLDSYDGRYNYKGFRYLTVYGEIILNNSLFTNNNIYGYTE